MIPRANDCAVEKECVETEGEQLNAAWEKIRLFWLLQQSHVAKKKEPRNVADFAPFAMSVNRSQSHLLGKPLDTDQKEGGGGFSSLRSITWAPLDFGFDTLSFVGSVDERTNPHIARREKKKTL